MKNIERVLDYSEHEICLFCGKTMKTGYHDRWEYTYCDCEDYKLNEEINDKITNLDLSRPSKKYEISSQRILIKIQ